MANTQIDVAKNVAVDNVTSGFSAAGTVSNDVRVVIKQGTTREEAVVTLTAILDTLSSGRGTLQ